MSQWFRKLRAPMFLTDTFPHDEQSEVFRISSALSGVLMHLEDFNAALSLYDFCEKTMLQRESNPSGVMNWMSIACRDGAMTLRHSQEAMEGVRNSLRFAPTLMAYVDHERLRGSKRMFNLLFPSVREMRNAVAHAAALTKDATQTARNAFSESYEGPGIKIKDSKNVTIKGALMGREYTTTHEGKILTYTIERLTSIKLGTIVAEFLAGFDTVPQYPDL